jgi:hypothetical protein
VSRSVVKTGEYTEDNERDCRTNANRSLPLRTRSSISQHSFSKSHLHCMVHLLKSCRIELARHPSVHLLGHDRLPGKCWRQRLSPSNLDMPAERWCAQGVEPVCGPNRLPLEEILKAQMAGSHRPRLQVEVPRATALSARPALSNTIWSATRIGAYLRSRSCTHI